MSLSEFTYGSLGSGTADHLERKESLANRHPGGKGRVTGDEGVAVGRGCGLRTTGDRGSHRSARGSRLTGSSLKRVPTASTAVLVTDGGTLAPAQSSRSNFWRNRWKGSGATRPMILICRSCQSNRVIALAHYAASAATGARAGHGRDRLVIGLAPPQSPFGFRSASHPRHACPTLSGGGASRRSAARHQDRRRSVQLASRSGSSRPRDASGALG